MGEMIDMTGTRCGRLTVIARAADRVDRNGGHTTMWRCKCDCGNERIASGGDLRRGGVTSCGCSRGKPRRYRVGELKLPEPITIQRNIFVGQHYRVDGIPVECIGVYEHYARFKRLNSRAEWVECWGYWDLQRRLT